MTERLYLTPKERREMHARQGGVCAACLSEITINGCIAEHWFPVAMGNVGKPDCLLCKACADFKTNGGKATSYGSDKHAIAKMKRITGQTKTGPKKRIQGRGFDTRLRKKMDGSVVERIGGARMA